MKQTPRLPPVALPGEEDAAFCSASRSICNVRFSRRSRRSSSTCPLVNPSLSPRSTCPCRRQVRSVCCDTPRSLASCDRGLSLSRISFTACRQNSGGNGGLVFGTWTFFVTFDGFRRKR